MDKRLTRDFVCIFLFYLKNKKVLPKETRPILLHPTVKNHGSCPKCQYLLLSQITAAVPLNVSARFRVYGLGFRKYSQMSQMTAAVPLNGSARFKFYVQGSEILMHSSQMSVIIVSEFSTIVYLLCITTTLYNH